MVEIRALAPQDWPTVEAIYAVGIASLELHERVGFRVVGRRDRIAQLHGAWRDTILLELRL